MLSGIVSLMALCRIVPLEVEDAANDIMSYVGILHYLRDQIALCAVQLGRSPCSLQEIHRGHSHCSSLRG